MLCESLDEDKSFSFTGETVDFFFWSIIYFFFLLIFLQFSFDLVWGWTSTWLLFFLRRCLSLVTLLFKAGFWIFMCIDCIFIGKFKYWDIFCINCISIVWVESLSLNECLMLKDCLLLLMNFFFRFLYENIFIVFQNVNIIDIAFSGQVRIPK